MSEPVDAIAARAEARVGTVLNGKWRLERLLGVGGMAAVYGATHRNGATGAVKILHLELSIDPNIRQRFLREGYVANSVKHRGAVSVLDDDVGEDGCPFLVMELLEGETLEARSARESTLDPADVLSIADQLLDVLAAAHAAGIVHRDIKPENVFLTRDGVVKVLDFGIARLLQLSSGTGATKTGATMGTPAYMAPEQARGLWYEVDARTDLWSVGATLFTLLTGQLVHKGRTANELLLAAMTKPVVPLGSLCPELPAAVLELVDRAVAFDKERRWHDATTMRQAVRAASASLAAPRSHAAPAAAPAPAAQREVAARPPTSATVAAVARDQRTLPGAPANRKALGVAAVVVAVLAVGLLLLAAATRRAGVPEVASGAPAASAAVGATAEAAASAPDASAQAVVTPVASASAAHPPHALRIEDLPTVQPATPTPAKARTPSKGSEPPSPPVTPTPPVAAPPDRKNVLDRRQ